MENNPTGNLHEPDAEAIIMGQILAVASKVENNLNKVLEDLGSMHDSIARMINALSNMKGVKA